MSFVHCPTCHRAYDLRRQASCGACRPVEAKVEAKAKPAVPEGKPAPTAEARIEAKPAPTPELKPEPKPEPKSDADVEAKAAVSEEAELISDAVLEVAPRPDDVAQRIAAMVEELAALVERASIHELEKARRTLDQRGLRSLWGAPTGGRRLLAAGERLVAGAVDVAKAAAPRRLVRRLRDAWAGAGSGPRA